MVDNNQYGCPTNKNGSSEYNISQITQSKFISTVPEPTIKYSIFDLVYLNFGKILVPKHLIRYTHRRFLFYSIGDMV